MAKYCGLIGFCYEEQDPLDPDVWIKVITEKKCFGDLIRNTRRIQVADKVNDDINVNNEISILLDPFTRDHSQDIRYATFMGTKWKVTAIDIQYPRIILSLGGVYNENTN